MDKEHRKTAILKMKRILNVGTSVLIFAEGGFNNTENLLCRRLFASPYILARDTGAQVVPVAPFYEFGSKDIYMNVGDPIDLAQYEDKNEALDILRDAIATLVFENFEKYASRYDWGELGSDPHLGYMEQRRLEYLKNKWHRDVWEEELSFYLTPAEREHQAVAESMDIRKMQGLSQEKLAEKAKISRSHLSSIEAPNIVRPFSLEVLYNIADALGVRAGDLLNSTFPTGKRS